MKGSRQLTGPLGLRLRWRRWIAPCAALLVGATLGTASAGVTDATSLADALARELGLTRSAAEIHRGLEVLERERSTAEYMTAVLDHTARESMRRWLSYRDTKADRDALARRRARALYKQAHGGAARLLFEGDPDERLARVAQARASRRMVVHDLRALAMHRRASDRATAELVAAARELQAVSAMGHVQPMREQVLQVAGQAIEPVVADARRQSLRTTHAATGKTRRAHAELIDEVRRSRDVLADARVHAGAPRFVRPVVGPVVGPFGPYDDPVLQLPMRRDGVEIRAPLDAQVRAMAAGDVVLISPLPGFEQVVLIDHGDGRFSLTGRLWRVAVGEGQTIESGDVIGRVAPKAQDDGLGSTVYVELRHGERPVDPVPYFAGSRGR